MAAVTSATDMAANADSDAPGRTVVYDGSGAPAVLDLTALTAI